MIQRVQTLFLLEMAFLSISLLFVPVQHIISSSGEVSLSMMMLEHEQLRSTAGHMAAVGINFISMVLCFITIFLFRRRELQVKLCYVLALLNIVLLAMIIFCPFVVKTEAITEIRANPFGFIIPAINVISAFFAVRFIKKDINLLKSADRIR
jgi:hypothetical protein